MGAIFGLLIVVILIGAAISSYIIFSEDSEETLNQQNTDGSIQEQLMEEE